MKEQLPELREASRTLLESAPAPRPVPAVVRGRLWQRLAVELAVHPSPVAVAPSAPLPRAGTAAPAAKLVAWALLGTVGALGALWSSGVFRTRAPNAQPLPAATQLDSSSPIPTPSMPLAPPAPSPATRPATIRPSHRPLAPRPAPDVVDRSAPAPTAQAFEPGDDLPAERALIAHARSELRSGSPLAALALLAEHAERFRQGGLSEEREALQIQALLASGDRRAAEAAAARFVERYPESLMGPAVRSSLRAAP